MPVDDFDVRPNCCKEVQKADALSVFLREGTGHVYDCSEDRRDPVFRWVIRSKDLDNRTGIWRSYTVPVKHCPFCGSKLPGLQKVDPPGPVCVITDGGYYCDTCGERGHECQCYPPEACWVPNGGTQQKSRVLLIDIDESAVVFRTCLEDGVAFVPDLMTERADEIAKAAGRKIVSVESDMVKTQFRVDEVFSDEDLINLRFAFCGGGS